MTHISEMQVVFEEILKNHLEDTINDCLLSWQMMLGIEDGKVDPLVAMKLDTELNVVTSRVADILIAQM
jgi:hypothetical protein